MIVLHLTSVVVVVVVLVCVLPLRHLVADGRFDETLLDSDKFELIHSNEREGWDGSHHTRRV